MASIASDLARITLDLFFPPHCALCRRGGAMICDLCVALLPPADGRRCERCWTPMRAGRLCDHCSEDGPAFASLRSAFVMDGDAREVVHRLKYDGMTSLAAPMAGLMAAAAEGWAYDLVVAVPLHRGRERSRGFNQSAELAKHLGKSLELPVEPRAARRTRATAPLATAMSREERRTIVAGAFAGDRRRVEGKRLLLVDDVATTGATLESCAGAMLAAGAGEVRCVTFARAGRPRTASTMAAV